MTLPYANIPQSVPFPAGVQSRPFSANDDYHYHTIPHNAPPQDPEPAYPRSHIEQPGTNNGSIMSLDPRAIMIHGPDAGIRWRRPFPTYKPRGAPDMRINLPRTLTWHQKMHLCPQPAAGQNPGYQPPTNSTWDQELENAGFPQAVHDKLWNFPQDLYKAQDGHGLGYDPNTTWPYMVRPYSVGASGPAPVRIYMVPSQNRSHNSLHWSGPSHPNLPGLGTGYVSLEGQKEFATDLRPEGQHFLGTPSPYHYVQMSYADRGVVEGASINGAQYAGDHGDRFHVPNELPHPLHSPVQDILNYPHGHNSANSDRQASSTPTLQLVKQDHNTANPIEETGRSEFTLEPRQVKTGRVRKPLTPQGRAEAAWNRTNGICDECRKKKVKVSIKIAWSQTVLIQFSAHTDFLLISSCCTRSLAARRDESCLDPRVENRSQGPPLVATFLYPHRTRVLVDHLMMLRALEPRSQPISQRGSLRSKGAWPVLEHLKHQGRIICQSGSSLFLGPWLVLELLKHQG